MICTKRLSSAWASRIPASTWLARICSTMSGSAARTAASMLASSSIAPTKCWVR